MREKGGAWEARQNVLGRATEQELSRSGMTVGAHHQQVWSDPFEVAVEGGCNCPPVRIHLIQRGADAVGVKMALSVGTDGGGGAWLFVHHGQDPNGLGAN